MLYHFLILPCTRYLCMYFLREDLNFQLVHLWDLSTKLHQNHTCLQALARWLCLV